MYPHVARLNKEDVLPKSTQVVIIGGGIIGVSTAYFLADRGIDVVVLEKSGIAHEQSSRNWGWVRTMGRDPAEIPLAMRSLELWEHLQQHLEHDMGFTRSGILYACESDSELADRKAWLGKAQPYGVDAVMLDRKALEALSSISLPQSWKGGLWSATDGRAEPHIATTAIAEGAQCKGARFVLPCAARGLIRDNDKVTGVVTESGSIMCEQVVLAGGAWSSLFCRSLGLRFPQLRVLGSVLRTEPVSGGPSFAIGTGRYSMRQRADGGYNIALRNSSTAPVYPDSFRYFKDFLPMVREHYQEYRLRFNMQSLEALGMPQTWSLTAPSPFERWRLFDPRPVQKLVEQGLEWVREQFPVFRDVNIAQEWAGMIDVTPDIVPVIDQVESIPGLYLSTGYSGHGFGIGPGAGEMTADLISGTETHVDVTSYRLSRFNMNKTNGNVRTT